MSLYTQLSCYECPSEYSREYTLFLVFQIPLSSKQHKIMEDSLLQCMNFQFEKLHAWHSLWIHSHASPCKVCGNTVCIRAGFTLGLCQVCAMSVQNLLKNICPCMSNACPWQVWQVRGCISAIHSSLCTSVYVRVDLQIIGNSKVIDKLFSRFIDNY